MGGIWKNKVMYTNNVTVQKIHQGVPNINDSWIYRS